MGGHGCSPALRASTTHFPVRCLFSLTTRRLLAAASRPPSTHTTPPTHHPFDHVAVLRYAPDVLRAQHAFFAPSQRSPHEPREHSTTSTTCRLTRSRDKEVDRKRIAWNAHRTAVRASAYQDNIRRRRRLRVTHRHTCRRPLNLQCKSHTPTLFTQIGIRSCPVETDEAVQDCRQEHGSRRKVRDTISLNTTPEEAWAYDSWPAGDDAQATRMYQLWYGAVIKYTWTLPGTLDRLVMRSAEPRRGYTFPTVPCCDDATSVWP